VRWSGFVIAPVTGSYQFQTVSDDGVRLWLADALLVDNWTDHALTADVSPAVSLVAGQRYAIRLEYYEAGGGALIQLHWRVPGSGGFAAIPEAELLPR
jgi:hypothetical protein